MNDKSILIVDDDPVVRTMLTGVARSLGHRAATAESCQEARQSLKQGTFDLMLLDVHLPDGLGLDLFQELTQAHADLPVIFMTGSGSVEVAVQAMRLGARDFLSKPFEIKALKRAVVACLESSRATAGPVVPGLRKVVGDSAALREVWRQVDTFAPTDITVLLLGESGTGKELFARAIHAKSKRAKGPFIELDCASIPSSLIEAELFGYEKGSFTDAKENRPGKFELASGGTVFLDEIGNLSLEAQAKLLRLVQERHFRRIGGNALIHADVRLVGATNLDLEAAVHRGAFRSDLYYRLAELPITLPALRERREDLPLLVDSFIDEFNACYNKEIVGVTPEVAQVIAAFDWPGNVRELANVIRSAVLRSEAVIDLPQLPRYLTASIPVPATPAPAAEAVPDHVAPPAAAPGRPDEVTFAIPWPDGDGHLDLKQVNRDARAHLEGRIFRHLIEDLHMNKTQIARYLQIDYKVLVDKLKPHGY